MKTTLPKISLILLIYNVKKYFQQCLDSIVQQTFTDAQNKISDPRFCFVKIMRHTRMHLFFLFCKQYFYRLPAGIRKKIKT